jgi:hypothetical protein
MEEIKERIIEIRPYRNGWQCFEAAGVAPYWAGENTRQQAIDYAKARARYGTACIRIFNTGGQIEHVLTFEQESPKF